MITRLPSVLYSDLLTVPYVANGRTMRGLDCVGLFVTIQRRLGRWMSLYDSEPSVLDVALQDWEQVDAPEPGDGILFRWHNRNRFHIAVAISRNQMIHAKDEAVGIAVERFDSPQYANRILGFYRWKPKASVPSA